MVKCVQQTLNISEIRLLSRLSSRHVLLMKERKTFHEKSVYRNRHNRCILVVDQNITTPVTCPVN